MSELIEVSLAKLEAHPNNIRKEVVMDEAFDDLVAGIKAVGVIHPPVVVASPTAKTKFRIVTGHRRFAAAAKAGLKKLTVDLHTDLSEQQQRDMQYQENKHRVGNSLMERAQYVANELDLGGRTIAELAKGMGVSQDQVRTSKKLAAAPAKAHARINGGQMNLDDALILAEFNGDPEAQAALLDAWGTYNWNVTVTRWRGLRTAQKQAPKTQRELSAVGAMVVESTSEIGPHRHTDSDLSPEAHVAAGHVAVIDHDRTGTATWYAPLTADEDKTLREPQMTEEELEEAAARRKAQEDLDAELALAAETRHEMYKGWIRAPKPGLALRIMAEAAADEVCRAKQQELVGLPEGASKEDVKAALTKLGVEACVVVIDIRENSYSESWLKRDIDAWGPNSNGGDYCDDWRDRLQDVYGYEWNDLERGFMRKRAEQTRRICPSCDGIQAEALDTDQSCESCTPASESPEAEVD